MIRTLLIASFILIVALSVGLIAFAQNNIIPAEVVKTSHDKNHLSVLDIQIDDDQVNSIFDETSGQKIQKEMAIENAKKAFPDWAASSNEVTVEYHRITNTSFKLFSQEALEKNNKLKYNGHMEKLPAYIVSFMGMSVQSNVPPDHKGQVPIHHEYNVIIDAYSGEALMGFTYR